MFGVPYFGFPPAPMAADPPPPPEPEPEPIAAVIEDENDRLREWRVEHLEEVGLPYPLALELALAGADWHRVARAVEAGMTVKQVESIFL